MGLKFKLFILGSIIFSSLLILLFVLLQKSEEKYSNYPEKTQNFYKREFENTPKKNQEGCPNLEETIKNLVIHQPALKDVERCFLGYTKRNKIPDKFFAIILPSSIYGKDERISLRYFENLEEYRKKFGFYNISPGLSDAIAPPYVYDNTQELLKPPYITTPEYFERKMSAYILMYLKEKLQYGFSFIFTTMYPPTDWSNDYQNLSSKEEFKNWIKNVYLKEVEERAKLAEKWGFEFYNPLPLEVERMLSPFNQRLKFIFHMEHKEIEELGQWMIDMIAETARKYFKGKLILPRYPFFGKLPSLEDSSEPLWENLDMKNYDLISFSLIPECNLEKTREFTKRQLNYYTNLAQKASKLWGLGEIDIMANLYEKCGNKIENIEPELWSEIIQIISSLPNQPSFIFFGIRTDVSNPQNPVKLNTKAFLPILNYIKKNF